MAVSGLRHLSGLFSLGLARAGHKYKGGDAPREHAPKWAGHSVPRARSASHAEKPCKKSRRVRSNSSAHTPRVEGSPMERTLLGTLFGSLLGIGWLGFVWAPPGPHPVHRENRTAIGASWNPL